MLAGGSEWPVTPLVPWRQIEMAITREYNPADPAVEYEGPLNPVEAISRLDTLRMHTRKPPTSSTSRRARSRSAGSPT